MQPHSIVIKTRLRGQEGPQAMTCLAQAGRVRFQKSEMKIHLSSLRHVSIFLSQTAVLNKHPVTLL